jgi:hypothetical protein
MLEIRPIKRGDFEAIYGHPPTRTIRGFTAIDNGRPVAVAGVYYLPDQIVAFCRVTPEAQRQRHWMAVGYRKIKELLDSMEAPVFAVADPAIPTAENLLMRCGFEYLNKGPNGEVFVWHKHSK